MDRLRDDQGAWYLATRAGDRLRNPLAALALREEILAFFAKYPDIEFLRANDFVYLIRPQQCINARCVQSLDDFAIIVRALWNYRHALKHTAPDEAEDEIGSSQPLFSSATDSDDDDHPLPLSAAGREHNTGLSGTR